MKNSHHLPLSVFSFFLSFAVPNWLLFGERAEPLAGDFDLCRRWGIRLFSHHLFAARVISPGCIGVRLRPVDQSCASFGVGELRRFLIFFIFYSW